VNPPGSDQFYDLKRPTISNVKATLTWAKELSIKIFIDYLDCSKSTSRQPADMAFDGKRSPNPIF